MTHLERHDAGADAVPSCEPFDTALAGIARVTDEIVFAYKEVDQLATRWSLLEAATASPGPPVRA